MRVEEGILKVELAVDTPRKRQLRHSKAKVHQYIVSSCFHLQRHHGEATASR
jgi:hypothetical protein